MIKKEESQLGNIDEIISAFNLMVMQYEIILSKATNDEKSGAYVGGILATCITIKNSLVLMRGFQEKLERIIP